MAVFSALPNTMHASAVVFKTAGVLITGPSGSGKSSLALQLLAYGAGLISDDLVQLDYARDGSGICLSCPAAQNVNFGIEARGFGLLAVDLAGPATLKVVVNMQVFESERLPPRRYVQIGDQNVRLFHKVDNPAFAAMLIQYCRKGDM